MNGRQRNATNAQIWGKKNDSNYYYYYYYYYLSFTVHVASIHIHLNGWK